MFRDIGLEYWRQPRFDWYAVAHFITQMGQTMEKSGICPQDLIHIGGMSVYLRGLMVFGSRANSHFRGTEDIDLLSFKPGTLEDTLDRMTDQKLIKSWSKTPSRHIPDKCKVKVGLPTGNDPASLKTLPIDLYQSSEHPSYVQFNKRVLRPTRIVYDAAGVYEPLGGILGKVALPSIRDTFMLKLETVSTERGKLRQKDLMDALWLTSIAFAGGPAVFEAMINDVIKDGVSQRAESVTMSKLDQLTDIYRQAVSVTQSRSTRRIATSALEVVKKVRNARRQ